MGANGGATGDCCDQEELEELDPGWPLQEGFVWDPHSGNTPRKMKQVSSCLLQALLLVV